MKWLYAFIMFLVPIFCVIGIYRYSAGVIAGDPITFLPNWQVLLDRFSSVPEAAANDLKQAAEGLRTTGSQFMSFASKSVPVTDISSFFQAVGNGFAAIGSFFGLAGSSIGFVVLTLMTPIRIVGFGIDVIFTI